jgi:hypothetical protein
MVLTGRGRRGTLFYSWRILRWGVALCVACSVVVGVVCKIVYWLGVLKCVAAAVADLGPMIHTGLSIIVDLFASHFQLRPGLVDIFVNLL